MTIPPAAQPDMHKPEPPKKSKKWWYIGGGVAAVAVIGAVAGGGDDKKTTPVAAPSVSVSTVTASVSTSTTPPVQKLTIPEGLEGKNAQIAIDKLKDLGFTNVQTSSVDPDASVPVLLTNWRVTAVEPGAGETVKSDSTIVLSVVKTN